MSVALAIPRSMGLIPKKSVVSVALDKTQCIKSNVPHACIIQQSILYKSEVSHYFKTRSCKKVHFAALNKKHIWILLLP